MGLFNRVKQMIEFKKLSSEYDSEMTKGHSMLMKKDILEARRSFERCWELSFVIDSSTDKWLKDGLITSKAHDLVVTKMRQDQLNLSRWLEMLSTH